ncbi:MAG: hypothetical protein EBR82_36415 [Caulobacteraceae bacterium]|nr:hypothetical protein [Caulobacteraceae bacterium]
MQEVTINDPFGQALAKYSKGKKIGLEIGGGTGDGSTQCIHTEKLFSIEISPERIGRHRMNLEAKGGVSIQGSAVVYGLWMNQLDIAEFYGTKKTNLNQYSLTQVIGWLHECTELAKPYQTNAIEDIHFDYNVDFDFVLIDGSPFSGEAELRCVRPFLAEKAIIALDDINDIKNLDNYYKLKNSNAKLLWEDWSVRNGAAIFGL